MRLEQDGTLYKSDEWQDYQFFDFDTELDPNDIMPAMGMLENLERPQFSLKDCGVTSRVFNNWVREGIIPEPPDYNKWAHLDFLQYLWIQVIKELRKFGVSLEVIGKVKDYLFDENYFTNIWKQLSIEKVQEVIEEQISRPLTPAEIKEIKKDLRSRIKTGFRYIPYRFTGIVLHQFTYRSKTNLLIFEDGKVMVWSEKTVNQDISDLSELDKPHLTIPLLPYFTKYISTKTKDDFAKPVAGLTEQEEKVLNALRSKQDTEVTIKIYVQGGFHIMDLITKRGMEMSHEQAKDLVSHLFGNKEYQFDVKTTPKDKSYVEINKRKRISKEKVDKTKRLTK